MGLIDKIAPEYAYRRAIARHNLTVVNAAVRQSRMAGYRDGEAGRRRMRAFGSSQPEDLVAGYTYDAMIDNAMQLYRDDPICKSIVNASETYLGESHPHATTSSTEFNELATEYFNDFWWQQADARNRSGVDFGEFQNLFEKWSWLGGDMVFVPHDRRLIPYEGTQIQTPSKLRADKQITNGVRVLPRAPFAVTHYYLSKDGGKDFDRLRANECFYAGSRNWRTAMIRSVPDLHGVIDALHQFGETNDNVQKRIRFESMLWTIERKGAVGAVPGSRMLSANRADGMGVESSDADWGMRMKVDGDVNDFKLSQMQNPQPTYVNTMEWMARVISAGTGYPYEIVMHIYTNGSYTANRAARLDFAKAILSRWGWRNKVLNQRVYNWVIATAIKDGNLPQAPTDPRTGLSEWHKCAWSLPHFPHIDEGKEVLADINQWGCGQESIDDWARQRGQTRGQLLDAHDEDCVELKRRAEKLELPLEMYMGKLFTASAVKASFQPGDQE